MFGKCGLLLVPRGSGWMDLCFDRGVQVSNAPHLKTGLVSMAQSKFLGPAGRIDVFET